MNTSSHVAPEPNSEAAQLMAGALGTAMNRSRLARSAGDHRELWLPCGCQEPVSAPLAVRSTGDPQVRRLRGVVRGRIELPTPRFSGVCSTS